MKSKFTTFCLTVFLLTSCSSNHYHDGTYHAHVMIYDVTVKIDGNDVETNNSVTGIKKIKCKQYKDRIEYDEGNGTTTVLTALADGSLKVNDLITFKKIN